MTKSVSFIFDVILYSSEPSFVILSAFALMYAVLPMVILQIYRKL